MLMWKFYGLNVGLQWQKANWGSLQWQKIGQYQLQRPESKYVSWSSIGSFVIVIYMFIYIYIYIYTYIYIYIYMYLYKCMYIDIYWYIRYQKISILVCNRHHSAITNVCLWHRESAESQQRYHHRCNTFVKLWYKIFFLIYRKAVWIGEKFHVKPTIPRTASLKTSKCCS